MIYDDAYLNGHNFLLIRVRNFLFILNMHKFLICIINIQFFDVYVNIMILPILVTENIYECILKARTEDLKKTYPIEELNM